MRLQEVPRKRPTVNITSLIDVLFLLLTFFLVTTSFIEQSALKVELPSMEHSDQVREPKRFILNVGADGSMQYEGVAVTRDVLKQKLTEAVEEIDASGGLVLRADRVLPYGEVMGILDLIRSTGIRRVSNATVPTGE